MPVTDGATGVAGERPVETDPAGPAAGPWRPRSELEVLSDQVGGIAAWHALHRSTAQVQAAVAASREAQLDARRRLEVRKREHAALIARAEAHLARGWESLPGTGPRAVVAHRNEWFAGRLCQRLHDLGIAVVLRLDNGADAVGAVAAEQPDLLVVEDRLPMLLGTDVVRQVRQVAPRTVVAAHVAEDVDVSGMLESGASAAFTRRVPPAEMADYVVRLLQSAPS